MKIFHRDKYEFQAIVINPLDNKPYYAFKCIKSNFTPELILVDEAKMIYADLGYVYFERSDLEKSITLDQESSRVKPTGITAKNLAENESKWRLRRRRSEVVTLTHNRVGIG